MMSVKPARNLKSAASLAVIGMSLIAACSQIDSPDPTGPAGGLAMPRGPSFNVTENSSTTLDPSTESMGTSILGPSKAYFRSTESGWYSFRATVSGGIGPYTYDWFQQYCYKANGDGTAGHCSTLYKIRSGVGLDSIRIFFPPEMARIDFVVHVYDAQTYAHVGTARHLVNNFLTAAPPSSGFSCDIGEPFWPVKAFNGEYYRRNGCTGAREWKPKPPE
jgi:hypothetical protein